MSTYTLTPNERDIHLLLSPKSIPEFDRMYPGYEPQPLTIELDWKPFEQEAEFLEAFKDLLNTYALLEHHDNLLYIVLTTFDDQWTRVQHAYDDYEAKKRARELAQLLLLLQETPPGKMQRVAFKALTKDAKVNDPILINWISEVITDAIINKNYPLGRFGDAVIGLFPHEKPLNEPEDIDVDRLRKVLKTRLINPKNHLKRTEFVICITVYAYLQGNTKLRAEEGVMFTDAQLLFLFDLLVLLQQVDPDKITSEPKDYMRTLLMNFINAQSIDG